MRNVCFSTLLALITLSSCSSNSEEQQIAINKIAKQWGGEIKIGTISSADTKNGFKKIFSITITNSPVGLPDDLIASNSALTFYKCLNKEEREKYTSINCSIITEQTGHQESSEFNYKLSQLQEVLDHENCFHYCTTALKDHNIDDLLNKFDDTVFQVIDRKTLAFKLDTGIKNSEERFGSIMRDSLIGFDVYDSTTEISYIGLLIRKKQNSSYIARIIPEKGMNKNFLRYISFNRND